MTKTVLTKDKFVLFLADAILKYMSCLRKTHFCFNVIMIGNISLRFKGETILNPVSVISSEFSYCPDFDYVSLVNIKI